jgi:hypothetical protein
MLKHHNDGKEETDSHRVYENDFEIDYGYDDTKEEAFLNYQNNVKEYVKKLTDYFETKLKLENLTKVDCLGEPIE